MIISARWPRTNSKFSAQEFKEIHRNIGSLETPKQDGADSSKQEVVSTIKISSVARGGYNPPHRPVNQNAE